MIRLRVKLFASLRERAKTADLVREFPDGTTVGGVWQSLIEEIPALRGQADALSYAVNLEYVEADFTPGDNDEVAFIPPVSGGSSSHPVGHVQIAHEPIDVSKVERAVEDSGAGAVASFVGVVRNENAGRQVLRLEYEAYEPMALSEMRKLAHEARKKFAITKVAITHRIGMLEIGEASVAIAVSAPHRAEAFDACRFLIDRIKEIVPIWKKEYFTGGEVWVGCQTSHPPRG